MRRILLIVFCCASACWVLAQNFGIDEPSPAEKLHVNGNLRLGGNYAVNSNGDHLSLMYGVRSSDNSSYEWIGFYSGTTREGIILYDGAWSGANSLTNEFSITAENNNHLSLNTGSGEHIFLMPKGSGNVGINNTSPSEKLDVNGYIKTNSGVKFPDGSTQTKAARVINSYFAMTPNASQYIASINPVAINGLSISLTPKSTSSKFLIMAVINGSMTYVCSSLLYRNGSKILSQGNNSNEPGSGATTYGLNSTSYMQQHVINYMDAPGTTSTITYDVRLTSGWAGGTYGTYVNDRSSSDMRTPSTLTILEFAE